MSASPEQFSLLEWVHYLENLHTQEIQLGLARIQQVASQMDLLKPACKVITVGGTNGKGSTVAALEAIYLEAGYQVGCYTSPHLLTFNERIRVNGQAISDDSFCEALTCIEHRRQQVPLSYFEMVTLAALWHFKQQPLDLIVLEVGLGGRQDATNCIDADLAIITTIDFDHQAYLGNTLNAIAYEKAGILRRHQKVIYADNEPPESILKEAKQLNTDYYQLNTQYTYRETPEGWDFMAKPKHITDLPKPKIQLKSAACAIMATELLDAALPVKEQDVRRALKGLSLAGRLSYVPGDIDVLYDVSHNHQAACLLANHLKSLERKTGRIHAVFSALKDKNINDLIAPLRDCVQHWYPAQLKHARGASYDMINQAFLTQNIEINGMYDNPSMAYKAACQHADKGDLIVVYGSFHTVGHVMDAQSKLMIEKEKT